MTEHNAQNTTDLEMMQNPDWWPYSTTLPLKRRGSEEPRQGVLVSLDAVAEMPGYLWYPGATLWEAKLPDPERIEYDELQSKLIDQGWLVD